MPYLAEYIGITACSITPKNFVILTKFIKKISRKAAEMQRLRKGDP